MSNPILDRATEAMAAMRSRPELAVLRAAEEYVVDQALKLAPELDRVTVGAAWLILGNILGQLAGEQPDVFDPAAMVNLAQLAGQRFYSGTDLPRELHCPYVYESGAECKHTATAASDAVLDAMMAGHYATYHPGESWPPESRDEPAEGSGETVVCACGSPAEMIVGIVAPADNGTPGTVQALCGDCASKGPIPCGKCGHHPSYHASGACAANVARHTLHSGTRYEQCRCTAGHASGFALLPRAAEPHPTGGVTAAEQAAACGFCGQLVAAAEDGALRPHRFPRVADSVPRFADLLAPQAVGDECPGSGLVPQASQVVLEQWGSGVTTAQEMRSEVAGHGGAWVKCERCTDPVAVREGGATNGVLCKRCIAADGD